VSALALLNGRVLIGDAFEEGRAVVLEGGRIAAVLANGEVPTGIRSLDLGGHFLMPGFIDTQVNGGGGVLFNDRPDAEAIAAIGAAHRRFGTTGFLPTLISDDMAKLRAAMEAVRAASVPSLLGIHLEGPFLNPDKRGIHEVGHIRAMADADLALLNAPVGGRTLVTLAPEKVGGPAIRALADAGVIVAGGHSEADWATVVDALDHGLAGFTHLFNAMSPLQSRAPGMVGAALDDGRGHIGIIVDGRHVHPAVLRIAIRAGGWERFMLVTDAMPSVGMRDKSFELQGRTIRVENGVCVDSAGTLAGSDLDMAGAVRNAVRLLGLTLAQAATMASRNPARFLGLDHELGRIAVGYRADLVLATANVDVLETWIGGVLPDA
jgi:N-acetylglucosamine-6-phosphate deacetylase